MDLELSLEFLKIVSWPAVVIFALYRYRDVIDKLIYISKVKLKLFGWEIEIKISELEQSLSLTGGGKLSVQQWNLLEKIYKEGAVSVKTEGYNITIGADISWIRPMRNAGILMSLPDGEYIELAETLELTPLGELLVKSKMGNKVQ